MWKITIGLLVSCALIYIVKFGVETGIGIEGLSAVALFGVGISGVVYMKQKGEINKDKRLMGGAEAKTSWFHGTAGFAVEEDIKDLISESSKPLEPGSIYLSHLEPKKIVALPRRIALQHGLILGATGTGKSRGYFLGNCAWVGGTSLVVTDPKSELWRYTSGYQKKAFRYAPNDPDNSEGFNWVPLCREARMAQMCARAIMESSADNAKADPFWIDAETSFLTALFAHTATLNQPTPVTAYRLFTRQPQERLVRQLLNSPSEVAQEAARIFEQTDPKIKGGIVPGVAAKLQWLADPGVARFCSSTLKAPDFGTLRKSPQAIYWCLREQDISRLRPLTTLFFSLLLEQIAGTELEDGMHGVPVTMLLDEFANIGTIPDFATTISLARGRGVALWLGVQSLSQLEARYGAANAKTIMANCQTKIALHGLDFNTAEYISKSLGETTVVATRESVNDGGGLMMRFVKGTVKTTTTSTSEHRRALLTPDEVTRLSDDEAIIRCSNKKPIILPKIIYQEEPITAVSTSLGKIMAENTFEVPESSNNAIDSSILDLEPPPLPPVSDLALVSNGSLNPQTNCNGSSNPLGNSNDDLSLDCDDLTDSNLEK